MKSLKTFSAIVALFVGFTSATAQDGAFLLGANVAYNMTIVANQQNYGQKELDYDGYTLRPSFGFQAGYDFNGADLLFAGIGLRQGGQKYKDSYGNGDELKKDIKLTYISIPLTYMHVFGGKDAPTEGTKFFVSVGPQFDLLQKAEVTHSVNGSEVSLFTFANHAAGGGTFNNFNFEALQGLTPTAGNPADDKEMFGNMDIKAFLGLGLRSYLTESLMLTFEVRGGGSLIDINADEWQLDGFKDGARQNYEASRNVFGGLQLGLNYRF